MPIAEKHQAPKMKVRPPVVDSAAYIEYTDALRAGDAGTCKRLRAAHTDDPELTTKFRTIERAWLAQMDLYIREIQIVRRERDGWKQIAEAEASDAIPSTRQRLITRGKAVVAQAQAACEDHEELEVPLGFKGIK